MSVFDDKVFGNGGNYVYYQRLATDEHFKDASMVYLKAMAKNQQYREIIQSINLNIVGSLRAQAAAEKQKEINVLRRIAPNVNYNSMSPIELINQINKLIGLRDRYEDYLKYIRDWYPKTQAKNMSPVVSSYMSTKIATIINTNYIDDLKNTIGQMVAANGDSGQIRAAAERFANRIIEDFIADTNNITTELLTYASNVGYTLGEENKVWEDIFNQINSDTSMKSSFIADVMQRFGLKEKVVKAYNLIHSGKYKTHKGAMRKAIELTAAPQGGYIYEVISHFMQGFGVGSDISTSRISDKGTADLLTAKVEFDYQDIVRQKVSELEYGVNDKAEAVEKMTQFTEFLKNNVGEGFIIYGNAKSYKLDRLSNMEGYFQGGTRNIQQLPSFMAQYDIPISSDTVELIINTIPGAILEGDTSVQEFLTEALAGQVAKLLFDDWTTIGDSVGSFDAIHVFNLSGITVPLSYLLEKLADAAAMASNDLLNHPNAYIQIQFNLPSYIMFPTSDITTDFIRENIAKDLNNGIKKGRGNGRLQQAWDEQRREALRSTFGVNFLSNFNSLLNELMVSLGI